MSDQAVYTAIGKDKYTILLPTEPGDSYRIIHLLDGKPQIKAWVPWEAEVKDDEEDRTSFYSDSPWLSSSHLIFSQRAVDRMGRRLREFGELLPVGTPQGLHYIYNVFLKPGALDQERSVLSILPSGLVAEVRTHVFHSKLIQGLWAFRINDLRVSATYLSHEFVQEWQDQGLEGLEFIKVWESTSG
jgi:hypothetical protein